ncbi:MAG TPA: septal ring lytic transglycosylase RlpA family protein [Steroidobacteraceae bacterium]|jgi:rare lipoprotein A|nr:septal ring lytic transglycosylase RlpA family protein [Steroidobacteraceae bacterium]
MKLSAGRACASWRLLAAAAASLALTACSMTAQRPAVPTGQAAPHAPAAPPVDTVPDALPRAEPRSAHGNPPFYDVLGRRYYVLSTADGYLERGVASWYGPTFHGGNTSSGEPYDMYAMSAAHKTLPLPCYARVTNLRNGRSVVVRINDRGPFVANRLIDLSYSAAAKLEMLRDGTTLVEVRALTAAVPDVLTRTSAQPPPALYVQAGAFTDQQNAQRLLARLRAAGLERAFIALPLQNGAHLYRVRLGPVESVAQFDELTARLNALGVPDARLAIE